MKVDLRVRGLLFDMDGVLMSSIGSVERSWQQYAVSRGRAERLTYQSSI